MSTRPGVLDRYGQRQGTPRERPPLAGSGGPRPHPYGLRAPGLPVYSISQVFLFGSYFKAHWLENLQSQSGLTLKILNPTDTTEWQILSEDNGFDSPAYRFVEPLSNIF